MNFLNRVLQQVLEQQAQDIAEQARKMQPLLVGDIHRWVVRPYAPFTEYGNPPNVIDSTAVVIDPDVPLLAAPTPGENEEV